MFHTGGTLAVRIPYTVRGTPRRRALRDRHASRRRRVLRRHQHPDGQAGVRPAGGQRHGRTAARHLTLLPGYYLVSVGILDGAGGAHAWISSRVPTRFNIAIVVT